MRKPGKKRCGTGKSCGATCIAKYKVCRMDFPEMLSSDVSALSSKLLPNRKEKMMSGPTSRLNPISSEEDFKKKLSETKGNYNSDIENAHAWVKRLLGKEITESLDPGLAKIGLLKLPTYESEESSKSFDKLRSSLISGMGESNVTGAIKAIKDFTMGEYPEIRGSQMGRPEHREYLSKANSIEALIDRKEVIKPPVEKFRGIVVTNDALQGMIESSKNNGNFPGVALASWSTELKTSKRFTDHIVHKTEDGNNRVILRAINSRGIPIGSVSSTGKEYEILTPSKANYKYLGYNSVVVNGLTFHIFDVEES